MANKKTVRKRNKKPKIADIIVFPGWAGKYNDHFLVLEYSETPPAYHLLNLKTGHDGWYDYEFWMRGWKKVA